MTDKEIQVQLYLANREAELGLFILQVIHAKHVNRAELLEHYNLSKEDKLDRQLEKGLTMTPQEELFAGFFRDEKLQVKDLSILELRAHREELAKIAFEARARLTAVDDEERDRHSKAKKDGKPTGFSTSLQTDELTSNAINKIKDRQKKLTKAEKTLEGLIKMGIDPKDAEKLMSAGTILARVRASELKNNKPPEPATNFNNPFAKFVEPEEKVEVTITEETATVVITKTETEEKPEPIRSQSQAGFINPFAKS